jgi:transposase
MLLLPKAVKVYVATYPVNLRKSFDGLSNEVRSILGKDPLSGHVFVFVNRRKTQVKLIFWSRGGFTIVTKRLEKGRFHLRRARPFGRQIAFNRCPRAIDATRRSRSEQDTRSGALGTRQNVH